MLLLPTLKQPHLHHRRALIGGHDNMVENTHINKIEQSLQRMGDLNVGIAWPHVARRMVMTKHNRR